MNWSFSCSVGYISKHFQNISQISKKCCFSIMNRSFSYSFWIVFMLFWSFFQVSPNVRCRPDRRNTKFSSFCKIFMNFDDFHEFRWMAILRCVYNMQNHRFQSILLFFSEFLLFWSMAIPRCRPDWRNCKCSSFCKIFIGYDDFHVFRWMPILRCVHNMQNHWF